MSVTTPTPSTASPPTQTPGAPTSLSASGLDSRASQTGVLVTEHGKTTIAESVVEKVAGMAAREIPGVHKLGSGVTRALGTLRERIPGQKTRIGQGVAVEVGDRQAAVDLVVIVDYGISIVQTAELVRDNVISSIEQMTGLEVTEVNIAVEDIHLPGEQDDNDVGGSAEARVQ